MHWLYIIFTLFSIGYVLVMLLYGTGWSVTDSPEMAEGFSPQTRISVLVPARNEAANIRECLLSILASDYPPTLWELLVIDDHSEDRTADIVEEIFREMRVTPLGKLLPGMKLLRLRDMIGEKERENLVAFKKKGIEMAIKAATGTLIVTTDADCIVQNGWLRRVAHAHERAGAEVIAAPVLFHRERGILQCFQSLDFLGMMGITAAGIRLRFQYMANGANLAYTKRIFQAIGGFSGIDGLASGDDMLLMQKVATTTDSTIVFLKDKKAATYTLPAPNLAALWRQRIRWASKSAHYFEPWTASILVLVFGFCWCILIGGMLAAYKPSVYGWLFLGAFLSKLVADFFFLRSVSRFFEYSNRMRWFFPSFILHTLYIAIIGLAVQFKKNYAWKGRNVH